MAEASPVGLPLAASAVGLALAASAVGLALAASAVGLPLAASTVGLALAASTVGLALAASTVGLALAASAVGLALAASTVGLALVETAPARQHTPPRKGEGVAPSRLHDHPVLEPLEERFVTFHWAGSPVTAREGETIAAALVAHGVRAFGHHHRDGAPQGIFCANGQCSQCLVLADGRPVKACITPVREGLRVDPVDRLPQLPPMDSVPAFSEIPSIAVPVLIVGGGPAGLSAALELAAHGVRSLLVDDKQRLGGKLVLQTHRFFGSNDAVFAGTRGIEIARRLEGEVAQSDAVEVWLGATAVGAFSDGSIGILRGEGYALVRPDVLIVATGAREKSLAFPGNTLPGVFGAGAFQTLLNRDQVVPSRRLFIVGGGNVGLIAGYHALQAGIEVVGLVEALPECRGYKVHRDKLLRLGVPIHTSHSVLSANGTSTVESVTVAALGDGFTPIPGTERTYDCDTVLIAVGLDPVDEIYRAATRFGLPALAAGDADEIAEASAAIFSGRIRAREAARRWGAEVPAVPESWHKTAALLKSPGGAIGAAHVPKAESGVIPVFHCTQEIPCNPCAAACPLSLIHVDPGDIRGTPRFLGDERGVACVGCARCVTLCPGLAITLVDFRDDPERPTVTVPYELPTEGIAPGTRMTALDTEGDPLGELPVVDLRVPRGEHGTTLIRVLAPRAVAKRVAGVRPATVRTSPSPRSHPIAPLPDHAIVCRCERVTAGEIRALIESGYRDVNEIKAVTRAGMGACGGKTCAALIDRLFRDAGVRPEEVTSNVPRPPFVEVPLGRFAGIDEEGGRV